LIIKTGSGAIEFPSQAAFRLQSHIVSPPVFRVDGQRRSDFRFVQSLGSQTIMPGVEEHLLRYGTELKPSLELYLRMRVSRDNPVIRFRYELYSTAASVLTNHRGKNDAEYLRVGGADNYCTLTEIQFSQFNPLVHSYVPHEQSCSTADLIKPYGFPGPMAVLSGDGGSMLAAYEHGCDSPDSFLQCTLDGGELTVQALKGNYYEGQSIGPDQPFTTVWLQLAAADGSLDDLLQHYRQFTLHYMADSKASRHPCIFYNSWNYQERNRYFKNKPYLAEMNSGRMLQEIDAAHAMGIDVFVIDTGWYNKTGDWLVNQERFPENMRAVRERLEHHGMKLGLWFNPIVAAKTSEIVRSHPEYIMSDGCKPRYHEQIWETEASYGMCLASGYADWFIEKLVSLHGELGVSYFKWDGIGQYGCDSPYHRHGTEANSSEERRQCYAYEMGRQMIRIAEEVGRRCPGAIMDFDVTEAGRFVGLGFLSAGKYFLINNGPYFHNFDIPSWVSIEPNTINAFFYPGPVRPRICRQSILYDRYLPSSLFLTHFLPDKPRLSQINSAAAMVLGGNGIWGDLVALDSGDAAFFRSHIQRYKSVADAVLNSYPRVQGFIGSSPEIYEKIDPKTGRGMVVFFTVKATEAKHYTQPLETTAKTAVTGADDWKLVGSRLELTVNLGDDDARIVYIDNR